MKMKPVHPGEILVEEFLEPMGISQYKLAKAIHVPLRRVNEIALCRRGITADTALRFGRRGVAAVEGLPLRGSPRVRAWLPLLQPRLPPLPLQLLRQPLQS